MNRTCALACQSAFREFSRVDRWAAPHAVTLTLKQAVILQARGGPTLISLTKDATSQNYRHFLNVLGGMAFGQAAKRFGKRLNSISTIEGGNGKRLHVHAVIDCPRDDLLAVFPSMITEAWQRTQWGHHQIDIQPAADAGWINYMSKFRDKPVFADAIDWENYHNADCRV